MTERNADDEYLNDKNASCTSRPNGVIPIGTSECYTAF